MKHFLNLALALLVLPALAALAGGEGEQSTAASADSMMSDSQYREAPMLAERVAAGELPPVDERLPDVPDVIEPTAEIGTYGGTIQLISNLPESWGSATQFLRAFVIERYIHAPSEFFPGLALDWDAAEDGKSLTLNIRPGLKWSDGEPFGAEDFRFMWEDILKRDPSSQIRSFNIGNYGGDMDITVIDDLTVRYDWEEANYAKPIYFSHWGDWYGSQQHIYQAAHTLKQWHLDYNENANDLAKEEGFESWIQLIGSKLILNGTMTPDVPTMGPYFVKELLADGHLLERNPYYYRVDSAGQQLPYIDYARGTYRADNASRVLAVIGGEVDFWVSHQASIEDFPVFKENEDKGGYNAFLLDSGKPANINIHVNGTYAPENEDPFLTELFQTKEFRQALSLAINRQEIVDVVFLGNAEPVQQTFNRTVSNFKEEWLRSYAEFDPDRANMLLDGIGLSDRDGDGFRLRPDGSKLEILFQVPQQLAPNVAASELITKYWQDVGLRILLQVQDIGIVVDHLRNSTYQLSSFGNEWGGDIFYVMFGYATWNTWAGAQKYWQWNRDNSTGWEPPQIWKDIFEAENRRQQVPMEQVLEDATWILDWHAENLLTIGVAGYAKAPGIIKQNLINTNPDVHDIWEWDRINAHRPYQWFFKN